MKCNDIYDKITKGTSKTIETTTGNRKQSNSVIVHVYVHKQLEYYYF